MYLYETVIPNSFMLIFHSCGGVLSKSTIPAKQAVYLCKSFAPVRSNWNHLCQNYIVQRYSTSVLSCKQRRRWSITYNCQLHESVCDPRAALRDLSNMVKLTIHVHVLRRLLSTGSIVWCFTLSGLKFQMNFKPRSLTFSAKFGGTLSTNVL